MMGVPQIISDEYRLAIAYKEILRIDYAHILAIENVYKNIHTYTHVYYRTIICVTVHTT